MTYDLYIGDRMFSSWSLRGWLMFEKFDIPCTTHLVGLYSGTMAEEMAAIAPARLVAAMRMPDGTVVGETMAMGETLAEHHPDKGLWPDDPAQRATARFLCAEMASGFSTLRSECPMQLQYCHVGFDVSDALRADLDRVETLWAHARAVSGSASGWLFGRYSLADAFYAPVAARIVGYGLPVSDAALEYCHRVLRDPAFVKWRKEAHTVRYDPDPYALPLDNTPWPSFD